MNALSISCAVKQCDYLNRIKTHLVVQGIGRGKEERKGGGERG